MNTFNSPKPLEAPTNNIRFVKRKNSGFILQQQWSLSVYREGRWLVTYEWRDVPTHFEQEEENNDLGS